MRNYILAVAASALFAAPAFAGESRAEVHGGVFFGPNYSTEAVVGVAAGHDFDLGSSTFAGVEASADKILLDDTRVVIGGTLRFGVKTEEGGRAYLTGGYSSKPCADCEDALQVGFGLQQNITSALYVKGDFRHFFADFGDANVAAAGIGMRF